MIQGAVLYAKNLEQLTLFYASFDGEIIEQKQGEYAIIGYQDNELTIVQAPYQLVSQTDVKTPPVPRSEVPFKPVFRVISLEPALDAALSSGGTKLPASQQWEFRSNLIQDVVDPEGNVIQLRQPI